MSSLQVELSENETLPYAEPDPPGNSMEEETADPPCCLRGYEATDSPYNSRGYAREALDPSGSSMEFEDPPGNDIEYEAVVLPEKSLNV